MTGEDGASQEDEEAWNRFRVFSCPASLPYLPSPRLFTSQLSVMHPARF